MPNTTGVQGDVVIASNVRIYNDCELLQVSIGAFTHIASGAWLLDVDIGRYCSYSFTTTNENVNDKSACLHKYVR